MNLFETFRTFYWIFKLYELDFFQIYFKQICKLYRASNFALQNIWLTVF